MRWAIIIGIDEYGAESLRLSGAVRDAVCFHEWVLRADGGGVPGENVKLLLGRGPAEPETLDAVVTPTKDNIVTAINDVVTAVGDEEADKLFFYFAGHGITARVANRDEGALVTPGFGEVHTDHSLAIRSLTEHFETTPFQDQFFFIDACRNIPWTEREFEIGRWPIPRRRDPGKPPVQQFILHATSPGLTAAEVGWPGLASGAFTDVLLKGLCGEGAALAWSWERGGYEVRWERLATYVHDVMEELKLPTHRPPGMPAEGWPIQIPQDAGSRGVADRDRDAVLASFPREHFGTFELTIEVMAEPPFEDAELSVLDALGEPVVLERKVASTPVTFKLAPRTYAARAVAKDDRVARVTTPIELYEDLTVKLLPSDSSARASGPGTIDVRSPDPLGTAEFRDEAGRVVDVTTGGQTREMRPGFYRVRSVGPEGLGDERFVALSVGGHERVELEVLTPAPTPVVTALATAMGGRVVKRHLIPVRGAEPVTWAQPSTVVLAGLDAALHGRGALKRIGLEIPKAIQKEGASGIALYAVAGDGDAEMLRDVRTRVWPAGDLVPPEAAALRLSDAGVAASVTSAEEAVPHWLSIEPEGEPPVVVALSVLPGRLATVVVQIEPEQMRIYQVHPATRPAESSEPGQLRRLETLQRLLLSGRLDGAPTLARTLADAASSDPFAGCLAGYVLLRLGLHSELEDLVAAIVEVAPKLSDAHILRGELEAFRERPEAAAQAFADAVNVGVPAFGEGLTRLLEGLRANSFVHPRGALVRHIFQRHARGSMWAAFTPRRGLQPNQLVISGADLGFEG